MSDVTDQERKLLDLVHELRLLRDAQDPAGQLHLGFQMQIECATTELLHLRLVAPEIEVLDKQLAGADRALRRAAEAADDPWRTVAVVAGLFGCGLLLPALWVGAGTTWFVGSLALLLVAVGALFLSISHQRDTGHGLDVAHDEVVRLMLQRDMLLGQRDSGPVVVSPTLSGTGETTLGTPAGTALPSGDS